MQSEGWLFVSVKKKQRTAIVTLAFDGLAKYSEQYSIDLTADQQLKTGKQIEADLLEQSKNCKGIGWDLMQAYAKKYNATLIRVD